MSGLPPIDITPEQRKTLLALLGRFLPGVTVWAYGSRVQGTSRRYSDLDLVTFATPEQRPRVAELKEALEESDLPFPVDLLIWDELPECFRPNIEERHVVAQGGNGKAASFRKVIEGERVVVQKQEETNGLFVKCPHEWEVLTLGEVCERGKGNVQTGPFGSQLHQSDYVPVGIPSIMPANIGDNRINPDGIARITEKDAERLKKYRVKPGDVVYSRRGDVERRALVRENEDGWLCGTGCLRVRFGAGVVEPVFAAHYLGHPLVREWIVRHSVGATMRNLNTSILSALPFHLPPLFEQQAIAAVLGALDDRIELNRRMNETLEAMARALFKDWFVDFGPTRAKAEGRPAYLAPEIWDLFPAALDDEDKPVGWEEEPLSKFFTIIGGGTPKTSVEEYWGGAIPWFSVVDAPAGGNVFVVSTEKSITEKGVSGSSTKLVPQGTTIISARGTVGKLAMAGHEMTFNQSCYGLRGQENFGDCFVFLAAQHMVGRLQSMAHGSVFSTITRQTFEAIELAMSSPDIAESFEIVVHPLVCEDQWKRA